MMTFIWAGWFLDSKSDKIWGVLKNEQGQYFNFWCRRGKAMQFKAVNNGWYSHKLNKGYHSISQKKLNEVYPNFDTEVNEQMIYGILSGKIRGLEE